MLELITILQSYGWAGLILAFSLFVIYKMFNVSINLFFNKMKMRFVETRQIRLLMHSIFSTIKYAIDIESLSLVIFKGKPVRQALIRELLICSLTALEDVATKIAKEDHKGWSNTKWAYNMKMYINELHTLFVNRAISHGIPKEVYLKYMDWYFYRLSYLRNMIDHISSDPAYPSPEIKTSTLLLFLSLMVGTIMADCEETLKNLNGEITGLEYNGGIIEPIAHK